MSKAFVEFQSVGFTHEGGVSPVFVDVSCQFPRGWTGLVGPNGGGKTTLLELAVGLREPDTGRIVGAGRGHYCPQRDDEPSVAAREGCESNEAEAHRWRARLGVDPAWIDRWPTLSHGERKRVEIAAALWRAPAILAIDEPTNHLDRAARDALVDALTSYRGVGLIVSHDRDLLDRLCARCAVVEHGRVRLWAGGYSHAMAAARAARDEARRSRDHADTVVRRVAAAVSQRRHEAAAADARRSKRCLARGDADGRSRLDLARVSGKDGRAGRLTAQLAGRLAQAERAAAAIDVRREFAQGIAFEGARARRDRLLVLPASRLSLGHEKTLEHPTLVVGPTHRIAVEGPNGSGKSTLVRAIVGAYDGPNDTLLYVPQEMTAEQAGALVDAARSLPSSRLGELMTLVRRLGSEPERLLATGRPSPGEARKLLLATGIVRGAAWIVMDEPTNHLDVGSVEALEAALADWPGALLLVSHDHRFLSRLTTARWEVVVRDARRSDLEPRNL